jgi:8-oxo-dGTP pyrophosphatase MutT (NUDIX family)
MTTSQDRFLETIAATGSIRLTVRSLCFREGRILAQRPADDATANFAFPGGTLELGDSLSDRIRKEYDEELGITIAEPRYLFAVENRFRHRGAIVHGLEHYFLVEPPIADIVSREPHLTFEWLPLAALAEVDLRPRVVREAVIDGSWRDARLLSVPFDRSRPGNL